MTLCNACDVAEVEIPNRPGYCSKCYHAWECERGFTARIYRVTVGDAGYEPVRSLVRAVDVDDAINLAWDLHPEASIFAVGLA